MSADNWTPKRTGPGGAPSWWAARVAAGLAAGTLGTALALAGTPAAKAPAAERHVAPAAISKAALTAISAVRGLRTRTTTLTSPRRAATRSSRSTWPPPRIAGTYQRRRRARAPPPRRTAREIYIAETGQYSVLAVNPATKARARRSRSALTRRTSPCRRTARVVYATVTGGDTGPGGSNGVAVIDPATNTVTGDINDRHRAAGRSCSARTARRAYVTTETGHRRDRHRERPQVARVIADPAGPQGIAVSPDGKTLYVTNPDAGTLLADQRRDAARVTGDVPSAGAEPYSVAVTPDGAALYVADMNSDSMSRASPRRLCKVTGDHRGRQAAHVGRGQPGRLAGVGGQRPVRLRLRHRDGDREGRGHGRGRPWHVDAGRRHHRTSRSPPPREPRLCGRPVPGRPAHRPRPARHRRDEAGQRPGCPMG